MDVDAEDAAQAGAGGVCASNQRRCNPGARTQQWLVSPQGTKKLAHSGRCKQEFIVGGLRISSTARGGTAKFRVACVDFAPPPPPPPPPPHCRTACGGGRGGTRGPRSTTRNGTGRGASTSAPAPSGSGGTRTKATTGGRRRGTTTDRARRGTRPRGADSTRESSHRPHIVAGSLPHLRSWRLGWCRG